MSHGRTTEPITASDTAPIVPRRSTLLSTGASHRALFTTCPSIQPRLILQAQHPFLLFGARGLYCASRERCAFSDNVRIGGKADATGVCIGCADIRNAHDALNAHPRVGPRLRRQAIFSHDTDYR